MSNQLKCALGVVKMKSAALHYEHLIALLHSCGADIGNIGHGRKQLNEMMKAYHAYLKKKINKVLTAPLPSTGIPPHFCTTSDKSTPLRTTNHAIMVLTMVDGKKRGIPVSTPAVYQYKESQLTGGTAVDLAEQVISSLLTEIKLPQANLSYLMAHQADGQYQVNEFISTL